MGINSGIWAKAFAAALLVAPLVTGCEDRSQERAAAQSKAGHDSMNALRREGKTDLSNPEMGSKVGVTLTEWAITLSHEQIPSGQITFAVTNKGKMAHVVEITGRDGHWKSMPVRPNETVLMAMVISQGTYTIVCPDSTDIHRKRGMEAKILAT